MIADTPFRHRLAEVLLQQHRVRRDLEDVGIPCVVALGTPFLVLDGDQVPVAVSGEVRLAANTPRLAGQLQALPVAGPVQFRLVQRPARMHRLICDA